MLSYSTSKATIDQFTRCTALELAPHQVRVNAVNPGLVDTGLFLAAGVPKEEFDKVRLNICCFFSIYNLINTTVI